MTINKNFKEIISVLAGIFICLNANNSCAKIDFRLTILDRFSNSYFHQEQIDVKSTCFLMCSRKRNCVGFAYDNTNKLCSLYDIDVANQGHLVYRADTEIFTSPKVCETLSAVGENTVTPPPTNNYPLGHRYTFDCLPDTYTLGSKEARCLPNGTWIVPDIQCTYVKTCHHAQQLGLNLSSAVRLKPATHYEPALFNCKITGSDAFTVAGHDLQNRTYISGHEDVRGFLLTLTYRYPVDVLAAVADNSTECEQYIKLECAGSAFTYQGIVTRNGSVATYYAGGRKGQYNCACHITSSCLENRKCNCDSETVTSDSGYIRYKEDLPLTGFRGGDTGSSSEYLYLTISEMRCKG